MEIILGQRGKISMSGRQPNAADHCHLFDSLTESEFQSYLTSAVPEGTSAQSSDHTKPGRVSSPILRCVAAIGTQPLSDTDLTTIRVLVERMATFAAYRSCIPGDLEAIEAQENAQKAAWDELMAPYFQPQHDRARQHAHCTEPAIEVVAMQQHETAHSLPLDPRVSNASPPDQLDGSPETDGTADDASRPSYGTQISKSYPEQEQSSLPARHFTRLRQTCEGGVSQPLSSDALRSRQSLDVHLTDRYQCQLYTSSPMQLSAEYSQEDASDGSQLSKHRIPVRNAAAATGEPLSHLSPSEHRVLLEPSASRGGGARADEPVAVRTVDMTSSCIGTPSSAHSDEACGASSLDGVMRASPEQAQSNAGDDCEAGLTQAAAPYASSAPTVLDRLYTPAQGRQLAQAAAAAAAAAELFTAQCSISTSSAPRSAVLDAHVSLAGSVGPVTASGPQLLRDAAAIVAAESGFLDSVRVPGCAPLKLHPPLHPTSQSAARAPGVDAAPGIGVQRGRACGIGCVVPPARRASMQQAHDWPVRRAAPAGLSSGAAATRQPAHTVFSGRRVAGAALPPASQGGSSRNVPSSRPLYEAAHGAADASPGDVCQDRRRFSGLEISAPRDDQRMATGAGGGADRARGPADVLDGRTRGERRMEPSHTDDRLAVGRRSMHAVHDGEHAGHDTLVADCGSCDGSDEDLQQRVADRACNPVRVPSGQNGRLPGSATARARRSVGGSSSRARLSRGSSGTVSLQRTVSLAQHAAGRGRKASQRAGQASGSTWPRVSATCDEASSAGAAVVEKSRVGGAEGAAGRLSRRRPAKAGGKSGRGVGRKGEKGLSMVATFEGDGEMRARMEGIRKLQEDTVAAESKGGRLRRSRR
eukprot:jgi/Ulvmu1/6895/UM031_0101.1